MKTDICLTSKGHRIIIDTKFYAEALAGQFDKRLSSPNLYQMHTYLSHPREIDTGKTLEGILLYPLVNDEIRAAYKFDNFTLRAETINLMDKWASIRERLLHFVATTPQPA
jgi:5-methylcytosine-specific restriction enzyme subunit McrC